MIVSSHQDDQDISNGGSAYIYEKSGDSWVEMARLTPSDQASQDYFSWGGVAISGDRAVVASFDDSIAYRAGSVYVFEYDGSSWNETQKLNASDGAVFHYFGGGTESPHLPYNVAPSSGVAIEGDVIAIGARGDLSNRGAVYVFEHNGSSFVETQKLQQSDGEANDEFGKSLAIANGVIFATSPGDDDTASGSGAVIVYSHDGSSWVEEQKLKASDAAASDEFGTSVGADGDRVVVGARYGDSASFNEGSAYIFEYNGTVWNEEAIITGSDTAANEQFGYGVDILGDRVIIGTPHKAEALGSTYGAAYVYDYNSGGSSWDLVHKINGEGDAVSNVNGQASGEAWGYKVALGQEYAFVGANGSDFGFAYNANSGAVCAHKLADGPFPPTAMIDWENVAPEVSTTIDVASNDFDIDGDLDLSSITIDTNAPVAEGTCSVGSNPGEIDFISAAGFLGGTSCDYEICDSSGTRCDIATLEIAVNPTVTSIFGACYSEYMEDGYRGICAKNLSGQVYCWGHGSEMHGGSTTPGTPNLMSTLNVVDHMYVTEDNGFVIDEFGDLLSWGGGYVASARASGRTGPVVPPATVTGLPAGEIPTCIKGDHSDACALMPDGDLYCWGDNAYGEVGTGVGGFHQTPVFSTDDVASFEGGGSVHCLIRDSDGTIWCSGEGAYGKLGDGLNTSSTSWVQTSNPDVVNMKKLTIAGYEGTEAVCALKNNGDVYCWGRNVYPTLGYYGLIGVGTFSTTSFSTPQHVSTISNVVDISAGVVSFCALKSDGTVHCWGENYASQLGDGNGGEHNDKNVPTPVVNLSGVEKIDSGAQHVCAMTNEKKVYCWGLNSSGQLGDGTFTNRDTPVEFGGGSIANIVDFFAGFDDTCVIDKDGKLYCAGLNSGNNPTSVLLDSSL